ncbi:MAG: hypothetical protein V1489_01675 [Candidatus Liptonbacteria bacterium]
MFYVNAPERTWFSDTGSNAFDMEDVKRFFKGWTLSNIIKEWFMFVIGGMKELSATFGDGVRLRRL